MCRWRGKELRDYARRQTGCRALRDRYYGIGELCAVTILATSATAAGFKTAATRSATAGWGITVFQSDRRRAPGRLSLQGPPALRWALYEAAHSARRPGSPDRDYYLQAAELLGG
jgi:transposase